MIGLGFLKYIVSAGPSAISRTITIDHTLAGSANSSNFPVLVSINDATLKSISNGGHVYRTDGFDITFYSDSGFTALLNWEVESYDSVNGILVAWVKIPTISHTVDTLFYMQYGSPVITTFQGGTVATVYTAGNAQCVYHLNDATDATSNNNGTDFSVTYGTGIIGNAAIFSSLSLSTINIGDVTAFNSASAFTITTWAKFDISDGNSYNGFFYKESGIADYGNDILMYYVGGGPEFHLQMNNGADGDVNSTGDTWITDGNWHKIDYIFDGSQSTNATKLRLQVDNNPRALSFGYTIPTTTPNLSGKSAHIGSDISGISIPVNYNGLMDEFRIYTIATSDSWRTSEYNNQKFPGNFSGGAGDFLLYSSEY